MSWWMEGIIAGLESVIGLFLAILVLNLILPILNRIANWIERGL